MEILRRYGVIGLIKLIFAWLYTKFFFKQARLIRFPFEIRNRRYIKIGKGFTTGKYCRLEAHPLNESIKECISIGENVQLNDSVHIVGSIGVKIGNNVLLASKIFITDLNHGTYSGNREHDTPESVPKDRALSYKPVTIEDNVWIGEFVSVLPGVKIGKGSIIGTMSVVTKDIPPYCIAVGSPARVIKKYDFIKKQWIKIDYYE